MKISKKTSVLILGITSIACSRTLFSLFDDSEGPNLLIVLVMAAVVYFPSLALYRYYPSPKLDGIKRLLSAIFVQILIVAGFYFCLN